MAEADPAVLSLPALGPSARTPEPPSPLSDSRDAVTMDKRRDKRMLEDEDEGVPHLPAHSTLRRVPIRRDKFNRRGRRALDPALAGLEEDIDPAHAGLEVTQRVTVLDRSLPADVMKYLKMMKAAKDGEETDLVCVACGAAFCQWGLLCYDCDEKQYSFKKDKEVPEVD